MKNLPWSASGIILAGGQSRRMGQNKTHLPWGDETLLERMSRVMLESLHEVLVIGAETASNALDSRVKCFSDQPRNGPLGAILTGLRSIDSDIAFVTACDMPFVTATAISKLCDLDSGASVTILKTGDGLHPLFGLYRTDCIRAIQTQMESGEHRVTGFYPGVSVSIIDSCDDPFWMRTLFNINTHQDYDHAMKLWSANYLQMKHD